MRTTVDLPDDLHARAKAIARDTGRTLSQTIADLVLRALEERSTSVVVARSPNTGLPVVSLGTVITSEDVRALEDDET
jgi:predicted transcriptional regulator